MTDWLQGLWAGLPELPHAHVASPAKKKKKSAAPSLFGESALLHDMSALTFVLQEIRPIHWPAVWEDPRFVVLADRLRLLRAGHDRLCIAWSGGLDSRFLTHVAKILGFSPLLVHMRGCHVPERESRRALERAKIAGLTCRVLDVDPLLLPEVRAGDRDRCYFCKRTLFTRILAAASRDLPPDARLCVCDGTNATDLGQRRPGLRALKELGIFSPLADAGLDKQAIRELADLTGLDEPNQPPHPCLLTRLDYGLSPSPFLLGRIDAMEQLVEESLHFLRGSASVDFRVRLVKRACGNHFLVQIALPREERALFREHLSRVFAQHGMALPEILFDDRVSGYFDRCE